VTEFDKVIPPGGVGKVTASLDTSHYKGVVTKTVQVTSKNPGTPPVVLQLKADVVTVIDLQPTETPVVRTKVGEQGTTEITASAADGNPFDVLAVKADPSVVVTVRPDPATHPHRKAKGPRGAIASGSNRYRVTIAAKPDLPIGQSSANVTLTTNRAKAETVPIRALLVVSGRVEVAPPALLMQPGPGPVVHARIRKPGGRPLQILDVASTDPQFTATSTPITPGHEYDIAVSYTGKPGRGFVNPRVTVKTNEPGQETIVIPVSGRM